MVPLNRDISDDELKGYLAADKKRSGSIGHTKVETKPQNAPLTSDDMQKSYHDQQKVPANVRRFVAPSEGDSIFNSDSDVIKGRLDAYKLKQERQRTENSTIEFDNPVDRIRKAKQRDHLRMTQQSPYKGIDGYSCAGIEQDVHYVSRKKMVQDPYNLPRKNVSPGSV